jgi:tetratricopeptide (TPR) repeat protein
MLSANIAVSSFSRWQVEEFRVLEKSRWHDVFSVILMLTPAFDIELEATMLHITLKLTLATAFLAALAGCGMPSPEARAWLKDSSAAAAAGDNDRAIELSSRFLRDYPKQEESAEAYYVRGLARSHTGQTAPAGEDLETALKLTKRKDLLALTHMELGNIAYQADDVPGSEVHFRAVLVNLPPGQSPADQAAYRLARVLQRRGRWNDADLFFDRVIYLFPDGELARLARTQVRATHWAIQAGAYADPDQAQDTQRRLRQAGLSAQVDKEMRGDNLMYLVRVGSFSSMEAGQGDLAKVKPLCHDAFMTAAR